MIGWTKGFGETKDAGERDAVIFPSPGVNPSCTVALAFPFASVRATDGLKNGRTLLFAFVLKK
jgi:hypothetical protein